MSTLNFNTSILPLCVWVCVCICVLFKHAWCYLLLQLACMRGFTLWVSCAPGHMGDTVWLRLTSLSFCIVSLLIWGRSLKCSNLDFCVICGTNYITQVHPLNYYYNGLIVTSKSTSAKSIRNLTPTHPCLGQVKQFEFYTLFDFFVSQKTFTFFINFAKLSLKLQKIRIFCSLYRYSWTALWYNSFTGSCWEVAGPCF